MVKACLASPLAIEISHSRATLSILIFSIFEALFITSSISEFSNSLRTKTRQRERRGEITSKLGFSVVAPIKISSPDST